MMCQNCSKLSILHTNKACMRCQGSVINNISVICEICSASSKQCTVCLKKVQSVNKARGGGCNCGKK